MSELTNIKNNEPEVDWAVFIPAVFVVLICAIPLMIYTESASQLLADGRALIMDNFLWLYLLVALAAFGFCMWLAFGRFGHVKLGAPDEPPEYSDTHWVAMMFTAAIGAAVLTWGFSEPIFYLQTPPLDIAIGSSKSCVQIPHLALFFTLPLPSLPVAPIATVKPSSLIAIEYPELS